MRGGSTDPDCVTPFIGISSPLLFIIHFTDGIRIEIVFTWKNINEYCIPTNSPSPTPISAQTQVSLLKALAV